MLTFWIIAGLMMLMALWFVLPPLWQGAENNRSDDRRAANLLIYQDQFQELDADLRDGLMGAEQHKAEKEALERRLLADVETAKDASSSPSALSPAVKKVAYALGAGIPIAAIAFYFLVGNPQAVTPQPSLTTAPPAAAQSGQMGPQQIQANVDKLVQRLQENPNDPQGWTMLGRSYMVLERFADAADAYQRATALNDKDANLWTDYAEALALANGESLAGKPTEALNRALQLDPKNEKALALAGGAAFQVNDYKKAIEYWQKLPAGSETQRAIADQLAKAKELAAGKGSR